MRCGKPESCWAVGLWYYSSSSFVVFLGVCLGQSVLAGGKSSDVWAGMARFDGVNYASIADRGYSYDPNKRSNVAFFPLLPVLARGVMVFGFAPEVALLIVSNAMLAVTFITLHRYVRAGEADPSSPVPAYTVAVFAFFPVTMFFHMAYSESSFLCLTVLTLLAIRRKSPDWLIAFLAGLVSASRPVGVALIPVVMHYLWRRSASITTFALRAAYLGPLSCWGLLAFMAYQQASFGDAFAFAKTQTHWAIYHDHGGNDKVTALLTLEPIWGAYSPSSPRYWARLESNYEPIFSLVFLNPIIFVAAAVTTIVGACTRLMTAYEVVLAAGLLLIPYVTKGYENSMFSMGRFAAVALPCYHAWGRLATLLPSSVATGLVAVSGFFLGVFAAMFAASHRFF